MKKTKKKIKKNKILKIYKSKNKQLIHFGGSSLPENPKKVQFKLDGNNNENNNENENKDENENNNENENKDENENNNDIIKKIINVGRRQDMSVMEAINEIQATSNNFKRVVQNIKKKTYFY